MSTSEALPKAILYSWPTSVWSTVPRLALAEKGYSEGSEYIIRQVDITKGENFSPAYLKINMNGTVPTLVVPTIETTGPEVDTRFRSLRDTITICDFLDQSRTSSTVHTTSKRPAPALSPATIEGKALSDKIIALVHLPSVDPNFFALSAQTEEELEKKAASPHGTMLKDRQESIEAYLAEAKQIADAAPTNNGSNGSNGSNGNGNGSANGSANKTFEQRMVDFLENKAKANQQLVNVYFAKGQGTEQARSEFMDASKKAWTIGLPDVLGQLEQNLKGPFALGDQVSLADLHVIAWLARMVLTSGGSADESGIDALIAAAKGTEKAVGPKIRAFWAAWTQRDSFKATYGEELH